jgi:hypothetical protein
VSSIWMVLLVCFWGDIVEILGLFRSG